jgi:CBS domain-containing protein
MQIDATSETSVPEIARLLPEKEISVIPVIDGEDRVLGIVSESNLLRRSPHGGSRGWWLELF